MGLNTPTTLSYTFVLNQLYMPSKGALMADHTPPNVLVAHVSIPVNAPSMGETTLVENHDWAPLNAPVSLPHSFEPVEDMVPAGSPRALFMVPSTPLAQLEIPVQPALSAPHICPPTFCRVLPGSLSTPAMLFKMPLAQLVAPFHAPVNALYRPAPAFFSGSTFSLNFDVMPFQMLSKKPTTPFQPASDVKPFISAPPMVCMVPVSSLKTCLDAPQMLPKNPGAVSQGSSTASTLAWPKVLKSFSCLPISSAMSPMAWPTSAPIFPHQSANSLRASHRGWRSSYSLTKKLYTSSQNSTSFGMASVMNCTTPRSGPSRQS